MGVAPTLRTADNLILEHRREPVHSLIINCHLIFFQQFLPAYFGKFAVGVFIKHEQIFKPSARGRIIEHVLPQVCRLPHKDHRRISIALVHLGEQGIKCIHRA